MQCTEYKGAEEVRKERRMERKVDHASVVHIYSEMVLLRCVFTDAMAAGPAGSSPSTGHHRCGNGGHPPNSRLGSTIALGA